MTAPIAVRTPHGVRFTNNAGELGILSGKPTFLSLDSMVLSNWVQRLHPFRDLWIRDELKQRASYIGTRQHLTPFLVPHRFEGKTDPVLLNRSKLAYGIGLNSAYLQEIFGHIRNTPAHYTWGKLGGGIADQNTMGEPKGGIAKSFWWNCTGDGKTWGNFFEGKVLEWMLTSTGGLILIDSNKPMGPRLTRLEADRQGVRSAFKFVPNSWIEDYGRGPDGYRWIKLAETLDIRRPRMESDEAGFEKRHVIYELMEDGWTRIQRFNDKGMQIGVDIFQKVMDTDGKPMLPFVEVKFGEHPDVSHLGAGLLMGLDDIVLDLFNLLTETREAFRDAVFTFLFYKGDDPDGILDQLEQGSRLVNGGDNPHADLTRVGAEGGEVQSGLSLIDMGLKSWALSAKRRATEAAESVSNPRSGLSLKAEFQLDLVPLMVSITETLDAVETEAMFIWAQIEGLSVEEADKLVVSRETSFQMEQEASRIARIVSEFLEAVPGMPASLLQKMIMRWAESIDFLNLDEPVEMGDGGKRPLREVVAEEATVIAEADSQARIRQNELGILGSAALGAELGGTNNGGGDSTEGRSPTRTRTRIPTGSGSPNPSAGGEATPPAGPSIQAQPSVSVTSAPAGAPAIVPAPAPVPVVAPQKDTIISPESASPDMLASVLSALQALASQVQSLAEQVKAGGTAAPEVLKRDPSEPVKVEVTVKRPSDEQENNGERRPNSRQRDS